MTTNENAFSKQQAEFIAMMIRNIPFMTGDQMQYFVGEPARFKPLLEKIPIQYWKDRWELYYRNMWNIKLEWQQIKIADDYYKTYPQLIVVHKNVTEDTVLEKIAKDKYLTSSNTYAASKLNLYNTFNCKRRVPYSYAIWATQRNGSIVIERADTYVSLQKRLSNTMNLLERLLWGHFMRYFKIDKLEYDETTYCLPTPTKDGNAVAMVQTYEENGKEVVLKNNFKKSPEMKKGGYVVIPIREVRTSGI